MKRATIAIFCFAGLFASVAGCQFGRFSISMSKEHVIPLPQVDVVPKQSEPEIVDP